MATPGTSKKYYGVNVADEAKIEADMAKGLTFQEAKKNLSANAAYTDRVAGKNSPGTTSTNDPSPTSSYVVKEGDNLQRIAKSLGVQVSELSGYRSGNPDLIYPGENLTVTRNTPVKTQTPPPNPSSSSNTGTLNPQDELAKLNEDINTKQDQEFASITEESAPTVDLSSSAKLTEKLMTMLDGGDKSTTRAPSLVEEFSKQRQALGVGGLEEELSSLDERIARLDADYASTIQDEEQKQVSTRLIGRKTSKAELVYNRAKRELQAERQGVADRIDTKLGIIKTMVELTGKDYDNAKSEYDTKFNQAIQLTNLIKGIEDDQKDAVDKAKDNARANMTVMYNLLKEGNLKYEDLDPSSKVNLTKMEIQAGLPAGMFRYLQTNIKDDIVASSTREIGGSKYYDVIVKGKDGTLTTKSIYIGKVDQSSSNSSSSEDKIVSNFNKDVSDTDARIKAGTNGQFMRSLYAKYPEIDKADIERKVNETYPEGWDD